MRGDGSSSSDVELLRAARTDARAFSVFYTRYERLVAGWLVRRTRDPQLAAELTAEVFAAAFLGAERFRAGPEPAGAWLLGIARNKLLKTWRRQRAESSSRQRLGVERIAVADEHLAAIDELQNVTADDLLADLPADQRSAVKARVIDELQYDEIARSAGVSPAVARKRVSRGLATLRTSIERREHE